MADSDPTTDQMFATLVNSPYYWSLTGLPTVNRRQYAQMLRNEKNVSLDKKIELLQKAGFTVKQEMLWNPPK